MFLYSEHVLLPEGFVPALLAIGAGRITEVIRIETGKDVPAEARRMGSGYLVPGLIDLQINGCFGVDFSSADFHEVVEALRKLPETGTTSICPTVITSPVETMLAQISTISSIVDGENQARNLGVHLEGPFLSSEKRGAHNSALLAVPANQKGLESVLEKIRILTLAPELDSSKELIQRAVQAGCIVSLGHTMATAEKFREAVAAGAKMVTHLFNAQRPIHQREPGISVATLISESTYFGIIVDGEHVHYDLVKLAQRIAENRMIVVSDASGALLAPKGYQSSLGGQDVVVDKTGTARRADGTLASSGLTQLQAIERAVSQGISREKLLRSATEVPAKLLGISDLGVIKPGARADLVYYEPGSEPNVKEVFMAGEKWKQ